ncbi:MAG TPA: ABC transporter ATP-binding protein [Chloroflexi bacterium]|nr:MAG: ABC transporter ATP-binding protein [Chloroflexota bacterium]HDD54814.1 ABC transporter ATP-binding protein [Chloroflexota bacterium]
MYLEMKNIVRRFPGVLANDHICLEIEKGEIHGLLGENGAGKTTLMNVLCGLARPDEGEILIDGMKVEFGNCLDAIKCGIGMVHQHFMLVPVFTVTENFILGNEPRKGARIDTARAREMVLELSEKHGLKVDPDALIKDISVGMQQRVEILKALSRGAELMILDEPTAVLTPQEVEDLYRIMRSLQEAGHTIIFITHKLQEIKEITDRVTVLRDGRVVGIVRTKDVEQVELARMMVGRDVVLRVEKDQHAPGEVMMSVKDLRANDSRGLTKLKDITFDVRAGEIVGIAGVAGNGQEELVEVLTGLRKQESGSITLDMQDISQLNPRERMYAGLAHIPQDRQRRGLVMNFSLVDNFLLGYEDLKPFARGPMLDYREAEKFASKLIKMFDVRTPGSQILARTLSGGNQQKAILAREFQRDPKLLIAAQPTRGLDVAAIEFIHNELIKFRDQDKAVLLISMELTEILDLSDRILVIYEGEIVGEFKSGQATPEQLGLLMAGSKKGQM